MGFVHLRPSADAHIRCPLPVARRLPSAEQCQLPGPVPPPRFLTALTACSTWVLRACCIPLPAMRFAVFPSRAARCTRRWPCAARVFPTTRLIPFEEFPSPAAVPRHRGRCPLVVAPRLARLPSRSRGIRAPPLQASLAGCASRRLASRERAPAAPGGCGGTEVPTHPRVCSLALPRCRGREPRDRSHAAHALC